jgi:hypothetical protein
MSQSPDPSTPSISTETAARYRSSVEAELERQVHAYVDLGWPEAEFVTTVERWCYRQKNRLTNYVWGTRGW